MMENKVTIAIIDDHNLFRKGLIQLVNRFSDKYHIVCEAINGKDFITQVKGENLHPEIVLLDVKMPVMNGFETAAWIREHLPGTHVIAVSMENSEETILRMLQAGIKGYLSKDIEPEELDRAILAVHNYGYYYTDYLTGKLLDAATDHTSHKTGQPVFSAREIEFLQWACSDYTYKEISEKMFLSVKTIDNYRESLFIKLEVKSRVGMVLASLRKGLVKNES